MWGQLEQGESLKHHYQIFIKTHRPATTWRKVKEILGVPSAHVEPCYGNAMTNFNYCGKDRGRLEGPWELGSFDGRKQFTVNPNVEVAPRREGQDVLTLEQLTAEFVRGCMLKCIDPYPDDYLSAYDEFWKDYLPSARSREGREETSEGEGDASN